MQISSKQDGLSLLIKQQILRALEKQGDLTVKQLNLILLKQRWVSFKTVHLVRKLLRELRDEGKVRHEESNYRNQYYWHVND